MEFSFACQNMWSNNFEIVRASYGGNTFSLKLSGLKKLTISLRPGRDICLGILGLEIRYGWSEERALDNMEGKEK